MAIFDTIITGGKIVDGTGVPAYSDDIGIKDGRIAAIGRLDRGSAGQVLDAAGLIVAPGFIDLHTHYDAQILWDPHCSISGWHGVTSVVLGNCGFGFAPVRPEERDRAMLSMTRVEAIPLASMQAGMNWDWVTFPEWLDTLERIPKGVNCLTYTPLAPLMIWVMGLEAAKSRDATAEETHKMQQLLHESMDAGACGFSFQRMGKDSVQADFDGTPMVTDTMTDRLILAFAEVLQERGEGHIQLTQFTADTFKAEMEDPNAPNPDWVFEQKLAEVSGRPVIHNVITPLDHLPEIHRNALKWVDDANRNGQRIFAQSTTARGPFTFNLTDWNLYDNAPAWRDALTGSLERRKRMIADPAVRKQLIAENDAHLFNESLLGGELSTLVIQEVLGHPELSAHAGMTVGELAKERGNDPVETLLDLSLETDMQAVFQTGNGTTSSPDLMAEVMASPYTLPGISDGGAHTKFFTGGSYTTDFLAWMVRDTKKLTLEEAHYRLSYLPAHAAGFTDRGFLRQGAPADIVVYDLEALRRVPEWGGDVVYDLPGGEWRRVQAAEGYRWILVNGQITFEDGKCTGETPGQLLRHGSAS